MIFAMKYIPILLLLVASVTGNWFDSEDMQLFDLVEEVNGTFYDFMNLNRSATASEVKKAFRVLSLKLHPDKSDDPNADQKFRQLVSISEVLKDESKRAKYDNILENGLPDWKTGMYYIRRARKLGLLEMSILVSIITTVGHYLCLIAAYYEKVYEVKELMRKKEKKLKKEEYEKLLQDIMETNSISWPRLLEHNLPRKTLLFISTLICQIPSAVNLIILSLKSKFEKEEDESESETEEEIKPVKKVRVRTELPDLSGETEEIIEIPANKDIHSNNVSSYLKSDEWTQEEILQLIKMSKKFPSGTNQRWERVACAMSRSVDDVTKMAKSIKSGQVKISESTLPANNSSSAASTDSTDITSRDVDPTDSVQNWTQSEQKLLEDALQTFPRGTDARWEKIAEFTGRSKDDCINRFKWLSELIKRKKQLADHS